jgi:hypothetical protein
MRTLLMGLMVVGAMCALIGQQRRRDRATLHRSDLNRWETEGGAVPVDASTAAQVRAH